MNRTDLVNFRPVPCPCVARGPVGILHIEEIVGLIVEGLPFWLTVALSSWSLLQVSDSSPIFIESWRGDATIGMNSFGW